MKPTLVLLALLLLLPLHARGLDPWTREQVVLEVTYAALIYVDWRQTIASLELQELNPLLPRYPSKQNITEHMAATVLIHAAVDAALPSEWRTRWQYVTVGWQAHAVWNNWQLGLTLGF